MNKTSEVKKHSFQHGARSIIQMGEELIGQPSTAINELVKNAYDADADKCQIYFHYNKSLSKTFVIILDNGSGMDEKILFGDWLQPSVSSKRKDNARSDKYKRYFLGKKGIGRLGAMALGRYVTVITKRKEEKNYNWITIDRDIFDTDELLAAIHFPGDQIDSFTDLFSDEKLIKEREVPVNKVLVDLLNSNDLSSFGHGTLIVIEYLDESVNSIIEEDFNKKNELLSTNTLKNTVFYKSLATLITPLTYNSSIQKDLVKKNVIQKEKLLSEVKNNFIIEFAINLLPDQDEYKIEWQEIKPIPILSVFDYRIFGKVKKDGEINGYFLFNRLDDDIHEQEFKINKEDLKSYGLTDNKRDTGEYFFDIRIYDIGESDNLEKLSKKAGFDSVLKFKDAFKNFQGLRVSKNGFSVKPYGEEVEDWIGLSKARVQDPGHNVNTNQILGYVFFYSPENDSLEEKTNREGFQENAAFFEVKNTLLAIFKKLGNERYNYRALHNLGRIPQSKHFRPDFDKYLNKLKQTDNLNFIRKYSQEFIEEVTTSMDNLEESLSFSERLASLGTGIELVYHEMAQPIAVLKTTISSLNIKKDKIDEKVRDDFILNVNHLGGSADVFVELRKSLQPAIGRTRKKKFIPCLTFLKVCSLFKVDFQKYNISIKVDKRTQDFEINDLEYAFWIAFLNILNNAVYWMAKSEKPGEIRFHMENKSIVVSNSGPLIQDKIIDQIFEYGVTTRAEKNATGLGLAFTRSALSNIGWKITAENRKNGPAFIITGDKSE